MFRIVGRCVILKKMFLRDGIGRQARDGLVIQERIDVRLALSLVNIP